MMGMVDVIHLMRQCKCEEIRLFSLFLLARPPILGSRQSACLNCSPAPGRGMSRGGGRFAAAGGMTVCLLRIMPCRSFAVAVRLVLRCGSDCPVPCDLSRLFDCSCSSIARLFY